MRKTIRWVVAVFALCMAAGSYGYASMRPQPLPPQAVNAAMATLLERAGPPPAQSVPPQTVPEVQPAEPAPADAVPTVPHIEPTPPHAESASAPIDLNRATREQLMDLPGIGESKAKAILELRTRLGRFRSAEQLRDVKGIGDKIFEKLKPFVRVSGS